MEARACAALHRVADGLLVSEQDLDRMEGTLMTLLETKPARRTLPAPRRRWDWAVAAVAVLALVLGGLALWRVNRDTTPPAAPPRTQTQPLVPPELVGVYQNQPDSEWIWEITADGRIGQVATPVDYLAGETLDDDRAYARDGELFKVNAGPCASTWRIESRAIGQYDLTIEADPCGDNQGAVFQLERIAPRDPAQRPLAPRFARDPQRTMDLVTQFQGTWVNTGTNQLLVVGSPQVGNGVDYLLDDDGDGSVDPDQRGVLRVGQDGTIRTEPDENSTGGCLLVFAKAVTDTATMVTTSGAGGCSQAGTTQTWLRLN
jgi:hypothetical protein